MLGHRRLRRSLPLPRRNRPFHARRDAAAKTARQQPSRAGNVPRAILGDFTLLLEDAEDLLADGCTDPADYQENSELAAISYLDLAARLLAEHGDSEAQAVRQRLKRLPQYWTTLKL